MYWRRKFSAQNQILARVSIFQRFDVNCPTQFSSSSHPSTGEQEGEAGGENEVCAEFVAEFKGEREEGGWHGWRWWY